jgi:hypothetical protein
VRNFFAMRSGGVARQASLNHRLNAGIPPGCVVVVLDVFSVVPLASLSFRLNAGILPGCLAGRFNSKSRLLVCEWLDIEN